jgi:phosphoribosylglycinamide formyltransferase-1
VEWVVLAGFMRLLSPEFLGRFPQRVLNIHPALLPAFPGLNAVRQALEHGVKVSGCTVHLVDSGVDNGAIIGQAAVPVVEGDSEESLAQRIHAAEHQLYVSTLAKLAHCDLQLSKGAGGREVATLRPK